ncbi:MAG: site-specific integrase [Gammaproteobacteria bacterium]|nr:site-specific integrase [Gammaproteobacteria bacterium]MBU0788161.1 site-specific integrase [Gammaproteobacteria bacterium]MBU0815342.1 site-specific integrase [Gammaproteobacteria bacterium]MBU1785550.1 site-specific integrase [Gammaproteobacteria bacterium]
MAKVNVRKETGKLVIDFTYRGVRCREQTALPDSLQNRKRVQGVLEKIAKSLKEGTFKYREFFPESALASRFDPVIALKSPDGKTEESCIGQITPLFKDFANQWVDEHSIEWRRSHIKSLVSTLNSRLIPHFGDKSVNAISKSDILAFRATLAQVPGRGDKAGLSPKRINEIIGLLRQILAEAAERFEFTSPALNIKTLRLKKTDVHPFSLNDVQQIMATVRPDYKNYFVTRFLTGMRTGEVHGLKWKYVDFDLRILKVRETFVLGEDEYTKTDGSQRDIQMSQPVYDALKSQFDVTGKLSDYVFCNLLGQPLDNKNFSDRVWYPLLRHLDLEKRRPYQMRHTAATLWLAAGEAPEWIARQLGHTSTEMLFRVYSRYVPNLTRQDGSAMERLLASKLATGNLIPLQSPQEDAKANGNWRNTATYVPGTNIPPQVTPKPRGIHGSRSIRSPADRDIVIPAPRSKAGNDPQPPPMRWMSLASAPVHWSA